MTLQFLKMNAIGNDFIIFDARNFAVDFSLKFSLKFSLGQIQKICDRKNIGCDQLVILRDSKKSDCLIEIYNQDGSRSSVCGNATRCVASLIMAEKNSQNVVIDGDAGLLFCYKDGEDIAVEMSSPVFGKNFSMVKNYDFFCVEMPNPHAVAFVDEFLQDEDFFAIAPQVENHQFFSNKTNVEFAKIISDKIIEVRVWERGVGETLACGSGACAVAVAAIKNNLVKSEEILIKFKGGNLKIKWLGEGKKVVMIGGYQKIFSGEIEDNFLKI